MRLQLKQLNVINFKGLKNQSIEFGLLEQGQRQTFIHGSNGTGKTSLFDSFIWCLFGKDHLGRKDHQIKTYDADGVTIPRQDVAVEITIEVDGKEHKLMRVYQEDWVKPRTQETEVLKSHTTKYYVNEISVKMSEYDAFVSGLCEEQVFKSVTNPAYFPSLHWEDQRKMLFSFVNLSDEEIAGGNSQYQQLLNDVSGIGFETFLKDIANKKRRINVDLSGLPDRIKGLQEGMPAVPDVKALEAEISTKEAQVAEIEKSLLDISVSMQSQNQKKMGIQSQINELLMKTKEIENNHVMAINEAINKKRRDLQEVEFKINEAKSKESERLRMIDVLKEERKNKEALLETLRSKWKLISAETLEFQDGEFTCPACKRLYEISDIEAKQAELTANFNSAKAKRLDANKTEGMTVAGRIKEIDAKLIELESPVKVEMFSGTRAAAIKAEIEQLEAEKTKYLNLPEYQDTMLKVTELRNSLALVNETRDNSDVIDEKRVLNSEISSLRAKIAHKDIIENTTRLIADHESQIKALNQELASLEQKEYLIKQFEFDKNIEYQKRINEMFEFVKFRLFKKQVDGQIVPDFECMVDGVPYSTLNNAMQVGAGLDIIRTISAKNQVWAPIWIDNREGVSIIPEMDTQVISLLVNPVHQEFKVEYFS